MSRTSPAVADQIPSLTRTIELPDMVAYAGATWDWHKLHYDPEYLKAKAVPAPVVDGQVFGALLVEQLLDFYGPRSWVRALDFRFKNLVFAGETIECTATVTDVSREGDVTVVTVASQVDVVGELPRMAAGPCSATVLIRP